MFTCCLPERPSSTTTWHVKRHVPESTQRLTIAGYVDDDEMDDYLAASDVCLCMRWPTSRETSASWLRCLAAGKPTIFTDLVHTAGLPAFDPRSWTIQAGTAPVGVSIDILDEAHSLTLAMRRLVTDEKLRSVLGANARRLWAERFQLEAMAAGYLEAIERALRAATSRSPREPAVASPGGRDRARWIAGEGNHRLGVLSARCRLRKKGAPTSSPG